MQIEEQFGYGGAALLKCAERRECSFANLFPFRLCPETAFQPFPDRDVRGGALMVATGELIRMMNYVDDIAATLRRLVMGISTMSDEERKRLAEYMKKSDPNYVVVLQNLESGK